MRFKSIPIAATVMVLLAACSSNPLVEPPGDMTKTWGRIMAPYGLYPFFPVRSGVQPGDVMISCKEIDIWREDMGQAEVSANRYSWRYLFSLDGAAAELANYGKSRMQYTYTRKLAKGEESEVGKEGTSGLNPYAAGEAVSPIGTAGFPAILTTRITASELGAAMPAGSTAAIGAGFSRKASGTYLLQIPDARYAVLPLFSIAKVAGEASRLQSYEVGAVESLMGGKDPVCDRKTLAVVGAAYYAREIIVTLVNSYASAAQLKAAFRVPEDSARQKVIDELGTLIIGTQMDGQQGGDIGDQNDSGETNTDALQEGGTTTKKTGTTAAPPNPALLQDYVKLLLEDSTTRADEVSRPGFPGFQAKTAQAGSNSITMNYEYDVPVAFGAILYALEIDKTEVEDQVEFDLKVTGAILPPPPSDRGDRSSGSAGVLRTVGEDTSTTGAQRPPAHSNTMSEKNWIAN